MQYLLNVNLNFFFYLSAFLFHLNAHKRLNISFDIRAQSLLLHQMLTFQKSMKIKPCFDVKVTFCYFCISSYEVRHFLLLHCTECDILAIHKRQKDKRRNKLTAYYVYCLRYFDYILSHQVFSSYHVVLNRQKWKAGIIGCLRNKFHSLRLILILSTNAN